MQLIRDGVNLFSSVMEFSFQRYCGQVQASDPSCYSVFYLQFDWSLQIFSQFRYTKFNYVHLPVLDFFPAHRRRNKK